MSETHDGKICKVGLSILSYLSSLDHVIKI